jgi:hypothetical protein
MPSLKEAKQKYLAKITAKHIIAPIIWQFVDLTLDFPI